MTDQVKLALVTLPLIAKIISFTLIAIGSFLVFTAFGLAILYALGKVRSFSVKILMNFGQIVTSNDTYSNFKKKNWRIRITEGKCRIIILQNINWFEFNSEITFVESQMNIRMGCLRHTLILYVIVLKEDYYYFLKNLSESRTWDCSLNSRLIISDIHKLIT